MKLSSVHSGQHEMRIGVGWPELHEWSVEATGNEVKPASVLLLATKGIHKAWW